MRRTITFLVCVFVVMSVSSQVYNDHDKSKLKAFLVQPSAEVGKTNGEQFGLTAAEVETLDDNEDWIVKVGPGTTMGSVHWTYDDYEKRISSIEWGGGAGLAGILDLSGCEELGLLVCYSSQLTALDVSGCTSLTTLECNDNRLTNLDISGCTSLTGLDCYDNRLTALDVTDNAALTRLVCHNNQLAALAVSNNRALEHFSCYNNQLAALNISNNTALEILSCAQNQLSTLNVNNNTALTELDCGTNQLTTLDVANNTALTRLSCGGNQLATLDVSNNTALTLLECNGNQLTTLDVSNLTELEILYCVGNQQLTTLDISHNIWLENLSAPYSLTSITVGWTTPTAFPSNVASAIYSSVSNATLYVPVGSLSAYKSSNGWASNFKEILEIGSTSTPDPEPEPEYTLSVAPLNLSFTALSDTTTFRIESNGGWVISVGAYWLSSSVRAGSGDSTVILVARANPGTIWRSSSVTISDSGRTVTQTIHVTQSGGTFVPTSISLVPSTGALVVGESLTLTATVLPVNASDRDIFWTSSNSLVATVTGGIVTAISSGSATITATTLVGELSASCYLTVTAPLPEPSEDVGIIAEPTLPLGNVGAIELSIPVPVDATFATSFIVSLPFGITLDVVSSALSSDLISDYQLRITSLFEGVWFFEITLKPLPSSRPFSSSRSSIGCPPALVSGSSVSISASESIRSHPALVSGASIGCPPALVSGSSVSISASESIRCHPELVSGSPDSSAAVTLLSSVSSRKIVTIAYTTTSDLPVGAHSVIISDLSATFSDGTSLEQKEIIVTISTVSTGTSLVAKDNVTVSIFGNTLTVSSPSKESLTVFTVNGTLLIQDTKEKGSTGINIGHLPRGVLIIRGSSGWTRKIIRQ
jgi:hypothetical protein